MFLVEEKMGAAAVDEEDELLPVLWRLAGGDVPALLVPVVCSEPVVVVDIFWKRGFWSWFWSKNTHLSWPIDLVIGYTSELSVGIEN